MNSPSALIEHCPKCGQLLNSEAKFCPNCGTARNYKKKTNLSLKQYLVIGLLASCVGGITYTIQPRLQGSAPTQQANKQKTTLGSEASQTSAKVSLSTASNSPAATEAISSEEMFLKTEAVIQKIAESEKPDPALMLEAVDLLSRILSAEPENSWALLQMAELAFEQRIFDKSSEFYSRYLKLEPEDLAVRTRYASSLTFSGKTEQAISELDSVLLKEPINFQALAFAAIANQQGGQKEKAQAFLAKAIIAAPSEEAKSRLLQFAESLNQKEQPVTAAQKSTEAPQTSAKLEIAEKTAAFSGLDSFFRNHPIAGSKYSGLKIEGNQIKIGFKDFPMDKMPPVIKEKFAANSMLEAKKESNGNNYTLIFVDSANGVEMHRTDVN